MSTYLKKLIEQGEHQQLDFKFEISDAKKIARTFSAFANTKGGILLIGVKDNGRISGVKTDEEVYMAEAAAELYCKPAVEYSVSNWNIDGKWVLEIKIPKSKNAPHKAPWKDNKQVAFVRIDDENHVANGIIYKAMQLKNNDNTGTLVKYQKEESFLLKYLEEKEYITYQEFKNSMRISAYKAEKVLINLISVGVLNYEYIDNTFRYKLR